MKSDWDQQKKDVEDFAKFYEDTSAKMAAQDDERRERKKSEDAAVAAWEKQLFQDKLNYGMQTADMLLQAVINGAAEGSSWAKGAAIMQVGIDLARGVMSAWASAFQLGPIAGPIMAGIQTVALGSMAGSQISKIQSASLQKRFSGGEVTGYGGSTSDSVPVMLSRGESVISVADKNRMGGQAGLERFLNQTTSPGSGSGININVSGNLFADNRWVQDQLLPKIKKELSRAA